MTPLITPENIAKQTLLIRFTTKSWRGWVPMSDVILRRIGNPEMLKGTKRIIPWEAIKKPANIITEANKYLNLKTVPFPVLGFRCLPYSLVNRVHEEMLRKLDRFLVAVAEVQENYPEAREQARQLLEPDNLFFEEDYPTSLTEKYQFEWNFVQIDRPQFAVGVDPAVIAKAEEDLAQIVTDTKRLAEEALSTQLQELVTHMVDQLALKADGKPKRFNETMITNLVEFIETFDQRKIFSEGKLTDAVAKCNEIISTINAKQLRQDLSFRECVRVKMEEVKKVVDGAIEDLPRRNLVFTPKAQEQAA